MLSRETFARFTQKLAERLEADDRFIGLLAAGSSIGDNLDEFSDLDLILVVRDERYAAIMPERRSFAASLGHLLYAFTGEHVGEPRLLICLYGDPVMHVDLKFVTIDDLDKRVEIPVILWERGGVIAERMRSGANRSTNRSAEWFEERFWKWIHYGATKLGRGELFETIAMLSFMREQVLGPMIARRAGKDQRGVRRIEQIDPEMAKRMESTISDYSRAECAAAIRATIELYRELRGDDPPPNLSEHAEAQVIAFIEDVIANLPAR